MTFTDGQWQNSPYLQRPGPCPGDETKNETTTISWSFRPQPDGTLRGTETFRVITDECGMKGSVYEIPMTVTRIGDAEPTAVTADPTLFLPSN